MESPSPSKMELIKQAIKQTMEEVGKKSSSDGGFVAIDDDEDDVEGDDDDRSRRILSKLMSQLEMSKTDNTDEPDPASDAEATKASINQSIFEKDSEERILKEIKKLKRQNFITHCLLSIMIVLTVAWQISEVSIILKIKDGVTHPFRHIGSIFKGILKAPKSNSNEEDTELLSNSNLIESSPLQDFKVPELPTIDFGHVDEE